MIFPAALGPVARLNGPAVTTLDVPGSARLDELMAALRAWLALTERPTFVGSAVGLPAMPYMTVAPQANSTPEDWSLGGIRYRTQSIVVTTFGRTVEDALWLAHRALLLLVGDRPPAASMVLNVVAEPSGTPSVDPEGRMLVEQRAAIAYA